MVYLDSSCTLHRPLEHQSSSSYYLRNMSVIISKSIRYPLSDSCTYSCAHTVHPTAEFPAIYVVSRRKIILTRDFHATTGEAQEADYESELKSALSSSFCSVKEADCKGILLAAPVSLQPASFPSSCLLSTCHITAFFFFLLHSTR